MATADHLVELRGEVLREHIDVIDAVVQATPGASRMSVVRAILDDWCERKCHEASLIQRVTDSQRNRTGNGSDAGRKRGGA
ncbi:hypothetical protein [Hydrogenophaga sp.]|uniref:hypothetical protein n=1 Tax=Hydrogenophaga sp. TaxID=1904254 RepID=UPI003F71ADA2